MGKKIIFSENQINEIIQKYQNGYGCTSICKDYGVGQQTINRLLKKNNINITNRKYFFEENIFDNIDTPEKAYWLGFILADGYVNEDRGFLSIQLSGKDKEHIYKFLSFIKGDENMVKTVYHNITGNELSRIDVCGRSFTNRLVELKLRQGKSSGKEHLTPGIPNDYIRDYIRGIWDGDGHIEKKRIDLISSIEVLAFVQEKMKESCDININGILNHCNTYRIYICKNRFRVLNHLYYENCCSLDRKYILARELIEEYIKNTAV